VTRRSKCRSCNGVLSTVFSLGEQYISSFVDNNSQDAPKAPLELGLCDTASGGCGLLQLRHTVPADLMFRRYWYRSGVNASMTRALRDIAQAAKRVVRLRKGDVVVDIGCNDGTLLRSYDAEEVVLVGFEPATNLVPLAEVGTTNIINDYFTRKNYDRCLPERKAKVITSIAMFYDLEAPNVFVDDVAACLDRDGVWIIQMSYLPSMLNQNAFDNICHEHLEYYSMGSLKHLLARHGLRIFDAELNDVNGGSFRVYVKHDACKSLGDDQASLARLKEIDRLEAAMHLADRQAYDDFASRVHSLRDKLCQFISDERKKGKRIYAYGASTKGNTLLQFCNLDHSLIECAAERNPDKWGKKTVGTLIPIISEEDARVKHPEYFLVLPWHFIDEFVRREEAYLKSGGKFIVPLPDFRLIQQAQ